MWYVLEITSPRYFKSVRVQQLLHASIAMFSKQRMQNKSAIAAEQSCKFPCVTCTLFSYVCLNLVSFLIGKLMVKLITALQVTVYWGHIFRKCDCWNRQVRGWAMRQCHLWLLDTVVWITYTSTYKFQVQADINWVRWC